MHHENPSWIALVGESLDARGESRIAQVCGAFAETFLRVDPEATPDARELPAGRGLILYTSEGDEPTNSAHPDHCPRLVLPEQATQAPELLEAWLRQGWRCANLEATLTALDVYSDDIVHELRTPLTSVLEFASILEDGLAGELNEKQAEYLAYIHSSAGDLAQDIEALRQRSSRVGVAPQELLPLEADAWHAVLEQALPWEVEGQQLSGVVCGDVDELESCLRQLAIHARRASRGKPVRCEHVSDGDEVILRLTYETRRPESHDQALLRQGWCEQAGRPRTLARVFGLSLDLARILALRMGGRLTWPSSGSGIELRLRRVVTTTAPGASPPA